MLTKGQVVYLEKIQTNPKDRSGKIIEGTVVLVGRKYYTVKGDFQELKFDKESLQEKTDYNRNYKLFLSKEDILNDCEARKLAISIRRKLEDVKAIRDNFTLDQLRRIKAIIDEDTVRS